MNPDVCGWLTLDHTKIDYPVVQGTDNFEYLEKDVLGNPSVAGSIFLDAKSDRNFHDFYTVIYELAVHTWGERLTVEDQMIALSTCSSGNTNGRHLLICKVIKENTVEGSETE